MKSRSTQESSDSLATSQRQKMHVLRGALKMSRPMFAARIGISAALIVHRELARAPWKQIEIQSAKVKMRSHLASALTAFEDCFGEPAFSHEPTVSDLYRPRIMKIDQPISAAHRAQLETTKQRLSEIIAALEKGGAHLATLHEEKADVEDRVAAIRGGLVNIRVKEMNWKESKLFLMSLAPHASEFLNFDEKGNAQIDQHRDFP